MSINIIFNNKTFKTGFNREKLRVLIFFAKFLYLGSNSWGRRVLVKKRTENAPMTACFHALKAFYLLGKGCSAEVAHLLLTQ